MTKTKEIFGQVTEESERGYYRTLAVAYSSPPIFTMLAEPWLSPFGHFKLHILEQCAMIHLYSRILDDAVDEGESEMRKALLDAQTMLWQAAQALAAKKPRLNRAAAHLIAQTCAAAANVDNPLQNWGAKNSHLLLAPLYLSGYSRLYKKIEPALRNALFFLQLQDELAQGAIGEISAICHSLQDGGKIAQTLAANGFTRLSRHILAIGRDAILKLENLL